MEHSRKVSKYTYQHIVAVIIRAANQIIFTATRGRAGSANDERAYLQKLIEEVHKIDATFHIDIPASDRFWYDISIEYIAINLKITNAQQADNALNKQGIISSITGRMQHPSTYNWRDFAFALQRDKWLTTRERSSEYHYLVIRKTTGRMICFRSILDVVRYIPNPSNVLQINWGREAQMEGYVTPDDQIARKRYELVSIIQQALRAEIRNLEQFALVNFAQYLIEPSLPMVEPSAPTVEPSAEINSTVTSAPVANQQDSAE